MREIAVIPKGAKVKIMGCTYTLLENTKVGGNQTHLDDTLKAQAEFQKGNSVVGVGSKGSLRTSN